VSSEAASPEESRSGQGRAIDPLAVASLMSSAPRDLERTPKGSPPPPPIPEAPEEESAPLDDAPPPATATSPTAEYLMDPGEFARSIPGIPVGTAPIMGEAADVVDSMEQSLSVPTATSVRTVPVKLLMDNRTVINNHLDRTRGGKVSFTHLIGYAIVEALVEHPWMNDAYGEVDGKPARVTPPHINFGIAIDVADPDGTRRVLVPNIKAAETLDFATFWAYYDDVIRRARSSTLQDDAFEETTVTLTNPGTIGTEHSVPRLMTGQGAIIGVGAMDYPAEYQGASADTIARIGVSQVMSLTSTYDQRIIQGAQSGEFLSLVDRKLLGQDGFYDRVSRSLHVPYEPVRWVQDAATSPEAEAIKPALVASLINAYRSRGHLMADIDPLALRPRKHPDLDVQTHGLTLWDLERVYPTGGFAGRDRQKMREVLARLRDAYCRTMGVEYMHIADRAQRTWVQRQLESPFTKPTKDEHIRVLQRLNAAEAFEAFLQTKYVGQKRFSLEGGESLIPLLDAILSRAAAGGLAAVCIGMAHRGRLNVLANLAGKGYAQIFNEFEGNADAPTRTGSGDVKYHLGTEGVFTADGGETIPVYLAANPSHLEAVDPVLEGIVRAKLDAMGADLSGGGSPVIPILVHGDAAFSGQGVVQEVLNSAALRGYRTGGTIHVVIDNQIGFTTGAAALRSTRYCTDVAQGFQVPIFHVNGDDPEACVRAARLAFDFRNEFGRDVIIDLVCYRRRGHNEADDPSMTQPRMYDLIEGKRSVRHLFVESLVRMGEITPEETEAVFQDYLAQLERVFSETREHFVPASDADTVSGLEIPTAQSAMAEEASGWATAASALAIARVGSAHIHPPEGFSVHPKLQKLLTKREEMGRTGGIDWGYAEILALGTLLQEGVPVRLAGQDTRRGTFVQRHAVFHDRQTGREWTPLNYLTRDQASFHVVDSPLSEYAGLGFEYGYSVERADALVMWEAQFGDFVNGAQTIIDEFISSAEQKWSQRSSLVMLLPHGLEGQGPDHSSARVERFLQLCAEDNMTVAMPSTAASYFHLLRRQAHARPRRPLVVFTPKSMLRLKAAQAALNDLTEGTFRDVLPDDTADSVKVTRVLLCTGKVFHDLAAERENRGDESTAIVRLEQLYPLPTPEIQRALAPFPSAEIMWVQEEPRNQGAWTFVSLSLPRRLGRSISVVSRAASASPAPGLTSRHAAEQQALVSLALGRP